MTKQTKPAPEDAADEIRALKENCDELADRARDVQEQLAIANSKLDRRLKALSHEFDIPHVGWSYNVEKGRFEGPPA